MSELKIVFSGPPNAGKTTAIAAISETPPIVTDVQNTDPSLNKERTTVAFDYGELTLEGGEKLKLYGTPGQVRFSFMWRILARGALGIILLIDNSREAPLDDLRQYLDGFADSLKQVPMVIGVGQSEAHPSPTLDAFADVMAERSLVAPVLAVDVRRKEDVLMLIDLLLVQMESQA